MREDDIEAAIVRIREKLSQSGQRLGPPHPESDVRDFERRMNIRLPEEYRRFILEVGDGGDGPGSAEGLVRLRSRAFEDVRLLEKPFRGFELGQRDDWEEFVFGDDFDQVYEGILLIADDGCSFSQGLAISGKHRGRVFCMDDEMEPPFRCHHDGFLEWYESWLDFKIRGWSTSWFGFTVPGNRDRLIASATSHPDGDYRVDAVATLGRMPEWDSQIRDVVCKILADDRDPQVRRMAAIHLEKCSDDATFLSLVKALKDPDATVRGNAAGSMCKSFAEARWKGPVLEQLEHEKNDDAICGLLWAIRDSDSAETAARFVNHQSDEVRVRAYMNLPPKPQFLELFIKGLQDTEQQARLYSAFAIEKLTSFVEADILREPVRHETDQYVRSSLKRSLAEIRKSKMSWLPNRLSARH